MHQYTARVVLEDFREGPRKIRYASKVDGVVREWRLTLPIPWKRTARITFARSG